METEKLSTLLNPTYLFALILLGLNDFHFKYEYGNFLTGKVSDFAGLFIFPYFISTLNHTKTKKIYLLTAIGVVFWKSTLSQILIDFVRQNGIGINRTADYSDYIALIILPISYYFFKKNYENLFQVRKIFPKIILGISIYFSWATSLPHQDITIDKKLNIEYKLNVSKTSLFNSISPRHGYSKDFSVKKVDSIFRFYADLENSNDQLSIKACVSQIDSLNTLIHSIEIESIELTGVLFTGVSDSKISKAKNYTDQELEQLTLTYFLHKLSSKQSKNIYYDNVRIMNGYE